MVHKLHAVVFFHLLTVAQYHCFHLTDAGLSHLRLHHDFVGFPRVLAIFQVVNKDNVFRQFLVVGNISCERLQWSSLTD